MDLDAPDKRQSAGQGSAGPPPVIPAADGGKETHAAIPPAIPASDLKAQPENPKVTNMQQGTIADSKASGKESKPSVGLAVPQTDIDNVVEQRISRWREAKRKANPHGFVSVAEEVQVRRMLRESEAAERGLTLVPTAPPPPPQTFEKFLEKKLPTKDVLIDSILHRRDIVALAGRRRHGKTTLIGNLVLALVFGLLEFLGYRIRSAARVLVLFLEDDGGELQMKLRRMAKGRASDARLALYIREDFYRAGLPIDIKSEEFRRFVRDLIASHAPDVIVFDNLAHLIGADYNNSKLVHELLHFIWQLTTDFNAAIIIAAHPRKRNKKLNSTDFDVSSHLRDDPEAFFEEVMGSSHFVNSCGSLWGLERNLDTDRTDFVCGAQRFTGQQTIVTLEKDEDDWFRLLSDFEENLSLVLRTPNRRRAWELLPTGSYTYTEARDAVTPALRPTAFYELHRELLQLGLVAKSGEDRYMKASSAHRGEKRS